VTDEVLRVAAASGLPGQDVASIATFDPRTELMMARQQRVVGVMARAVRAGEIECHDPGVLFDAHRHTMVAALALEDRLLDAVDVLDRAGVETRVVKGAALAHLLGPTEDRDFGDTDLLVRPGELRAAVAALEAAGAERKFAPLSAMWEDRFAKSVTLRWHGTELDLHRTLAPGPFGLIIDGDELFTRSASFVLADTSLSTLSVAHHLLHAAIHIALGDIEPRLGNVRDLALLLGRDDVDHDEVVGTALRWGVQAPVAEAIQHAVVLGCVTNALTDWSAKFRPTRHERALMATYRDRDGRFRRQAVASLRVLRWRDRVAYIRAVRPGAAGTLPR